MNKSRSTVRNERLRFCEDWHCFMAQIALILLVGKVLLKFLADDKQIGAYHKATNCHFEF